MIIERYIARNYVGPFFFSVSVITFLFIMDFILRYIDLFLNKGVRFLVVLQTFILSLGHMFALIIPMAVLPATLMAFGNLTSENEVTAMKASGISLYRMMMPGIFFGILLTVGMILYNNHVLPESNHMLLNLLIDINKKKPTVEIKENVFIDAFEGYTIYVREKNDKTGDVKDVQIFKHREAGQLPTTIVADKGHVAYLEREHILRFELQDGEIHEMPEGSDPSTYRRTVFKNYIINIDDIDRSLKRSERKYRGDREMSVRMMRDKIASIRNDIAGVDKKMAEMANTQVSEVLQFLNPATRDTLLGGAAQDGTPGATQGEPAVLPARRRDGSENAGQDNDARPAAGAAADDGAQVAAAAPVGHPRTQRPKREQVAVTARALNSQHEIKQSYLRQVNRYRVEIHKKYSIPFACLVFVLIGSPIALRMGRSGMNMAIGLSILVFLVYYICLIGGEKLADRLIVSPVFAMWVPNLIFGIVAMYLIRRTTLEQSAVQWTRFNPFKRFMKTT